MRVLAVVWWNRAVRDDIQSEGSMGEIVALAGFVVLIGLLVSGMIREQCH
jgi:hypothetical protein